MMYLGDKAVGINNDEAEQYIQGLARTITSLSSKRITELGYMAFSNCSQLIYVSLPNLTTLTGGYVFSGCYNIQEAYFPNLVQTANAFLMSEKLQYLALPKANGLANSTILCPNLKAIDIGGIQGGILPGNFNKDIALKTIVLRRNTLITLSRLNEIETTPFGSSGSGGTLYVPNDLISSYQSAQNWSTLLSYSNNKILSIEDSIYETQYVDGTPIN